MDFEKTAVNLMISPTTVKADLDEFSGDNEFIYYEGLDDVEVACKKTSYLINFEPLDISVPQLLALGRANHPILDAHQPAPGRKITQNKVKNGMPLAKKPEDSPKSSISSAPSSSSSS